MPRYMLLIFDDEAAFDQVSPEDAQAMTDQYYAFGDTFRDKIVAGEALLPTPTAKLVRIRDGERTTTDGPYAETKEQLGGFYLIDSDSEEEALEIGSRIPSARTGTIEVRQCMEFPERPDHGGQAVEAQRQG